MIRHCREGRALEESHTTVIGMVLEGCTTDLCPKSLNASHSADAIELVVCRRDARLSAGCFSARFDLFFNSTQLLIYFVPV